MNKVSDVLSQKFTQDPLLLQNLYTFANSILLELEKINYPSMTLVMPKGFTFTFPKRIHANNSR